MPRGKLQLKPLQTKHFPFQEYLAAYRYIDENRETTMKVIIDVAGVSLRGAGKARKSAKRPPPWGRPFGVPMSIAVSAWRQLPPPLRTRIHCQPS